ncbi:hypothetical protein LY78DRAFT_711354 [Colletotrichum sublineola]|nr:hypothetical protein LY78DRAFT_711354 [Colletotrichum sublineola]
MADVPLNPDRPSPEPISPPLPRSADQALAPNTNGNRVAKKKAAGKPTRAVKANSCDACRRSKVKCVAVEGFASCAACLKKNRECCVSGADGRTNKTNQSRIDTAAAVVNTYLKDALIFCSEFTEQPAHRATVQALLNTMSDFQKARSFLSQVTGCPMKEVQFRAGPFRPPVFDGSAKLTEVRKYRIPMLQAMALEQGQVVASLLITLAFGDDAKVSVASRLIGDVMHKGVALDSLKHFIRINCPPPDDHAVVYNNMRQGVQNCLDSVLA